MAAAPRPRRRWTRRLLGLALGLALLELAVRVMLTLPPWSRDLLARPPHLFYGELAAIEDAPPAAPDDVEVLLLGGSVLDPRWGQVAGRLRVALDAALGALHPEHPPRVVVYDLARVGQTSLDSLYKYRRLQGRPFDAVVVYHGINDVRPNLCPPELFEDDYGHYVWYRALRGLEPSPAEPLAAPSDGWFMLPIAARYAALSLAGRLGLIDVLPPGRPPPDWIDEGADLKTGRPFRRNVEGIAQLAEAKGDPLLLVQFAARNVPVPLPEGATEPVLDAEEPPPGLWLWGRPEHVLAGVAAHNAVLSDLAALHAGVALIDMRSLLEGGDELFRDGCHLTPKGSETFVRLLLPALLDAIERVPSRPR
jgi:hypothetical protein